MPSIAERFSVTLYASATSLPSSVWGVFDAFQYQSNIIYPHALQARSREAVGQQSKGIWIVCTTSSLRGAPSVDFVLSCTEGHLGPYPIFIFTPLPPDSLYHDYLYPRLQAIAELLYKSVPIERVFSVFSLDAVTTTFTSIWTKKTGVPLEREPIYYAAKGTHCTKNTFRPARKMTLLPGTTYDLRLARKDDVQSVAELCYGFASESEPFVLSREDAAREAELLINGGKMWVHEIQQYGCAPEIASIVAVTRTSSAVAGITKVYTNPRWRKRGCAERLTRQVTKHLLKTKEAVVLYVAHNNPAAAGIYRRVGFVGLGPEVTPVDGVYSWLEQGFDRSQVQLGHW